MGGPFAIELKRIFQGEVDETQRSHMVLERRQSVVANGQTGRLGPSLEWTRTVPDLEHMQVTIAPADGRTTIHIQQQFAGGAYVTYFVTTAMTLLAAIAITNRIDLSVLVEAALSLGSLAGVLVRHLETIVTEVERVAGDTGSSDKYDEPATEGRVPLPDETATRQRFPTSKPQDRTRTR